MCLYPEILFHLTNQESLYEILRHDFKLSYAREKIISPTRQREFAVPMVSFCDLRLSELRSIVGRADTYGKFGIGLTKEWANRQKLSAIMYINKHSNITDDLMAGIEGVYRQFERLNSQEEIRMFTEAYNNIMNIYRYIKNYEGELIRHNILQDDNYRFANEREWRYVPPIETEGVAAFVPIERIRTEEQKQQFNNSVSHLSLTFEPNDIKYLIVENEDHITGLINHLWEAKVRFTPETIQRLSSRILTVDQILKDI